MCRDRDIIVAPTNSGLVSRISTIRQHCPQIVWSFWAKDTGTLLKDCSYFIKTQHSCFKCSIKTIHLGWNAITKIPGLWVIVVCSMSKHRKQTGHKDPGKDFLVAMVTTSSEIVKISAGKGEELLRPQLWLRSYWQLMFAGGGRLAFPLKCAHW